MAKADIDFEKELWDAANELRGAVSENNYKNYILPLVFLKHLSERYEVVQEEIKTLINDPKSDYYTTDQDEMMYVMEDEDEYRSRNTFKIPHTASWQHLKDNAEQDNIKVIVDDAFEAIQDILTAFIGISGNLATATKKYTNNGGEGKPALDLAAAVRICLLQYEKMCRLLGDYDFEEFQAMTDGERMKWSNDIVNEILKAEVTTDHFLQEERKLSELMAMTSSDPKIWEIQAEVGVVQKIRETIRKIKFPPTQQRKKNQRIKDLISQSLESHAIVDLAAMYDLERIDISIIDDRFQAIVKEKGSENIKIELLKRIVNDELRIRKPKNILKMTNLKAELDRILSKYHKNSLDSIAAIKHLLDLADEFKNEDKRTKELGLSEDELAFYDLLAANEKLLNTKGPMQDLVHKVVDSVKKNLQLDWTRKENAKAAIRLAVKKELRGKVPFSELDKLLKEVIEQAEGQYRDWPMVG